MSDERTVYVYENWKSDKPALIGRLYAEAGRGRQSYSFEYEESWLRDLKNNASLDPDLNLFRGRQYTPPDKLLFGAFEDSCPDRWGRLLMKRREAILAKREKRKPCNLTELDYLLGVSDETRMGGLRFSMQEGGPFLSYDHDLPTPPWTTLRTLEAASVAFEKSEGSEEEKWLRQLISPGSSLGGARPKASVLAPDGSLWIAKFPSKNDETDVGAWEMVVHDLALLCGLNVPDAKLEKFSKHGSTFITKRFDRNGQKRIHFASAMTLLGKTDGMDAAEGSGYSDIASIITAQSISPQKDLLELWRRIVFNMAVSNTDDHLRNHGFLLCKNGWQLSPLYDVNPDMYGDTLSLNIDTDSNLIDFNLALSVAPLYGLTDLRAEEELERIKNIVVKEWRRKADEYGLSRSETEKMAPAFDVNYK